MTNRHTHDERDAWHSSDANQAAILTHGIGVIDGFGISVAAETIEIESGTGWFGEIVEFDSETLDVEPASSNPRKVVIYGDDDGDLHAAHGGSAEPRPRDKTGRQTYHPSPPDLSGTDAMVLYEIWVPPISDLDSSNVTDRRDESRIDVHEIVSHLAAVESLEASDASIEEADIETLVSELVETETSKPTERQHLPQYSSVDNAPQEAPSLIEVPPDGATEPPGLYYYNEGEGEYQFIQADVDVVSSGDLSDLNIDASRDWGGHDIDNVGKLDSNEAEIAEASIESSRSEEPHIQEQVPTNNKSEFFNVGRMFEPFDQSKSGDWIGDWEIQDGDAEIDTDEYYTGTQSVRATVDSDDGFRLVNDSIDPIDLTTTRFGMVLKGTAGVERVVYIRCYDDQGNRADVSHEWNTESEEETTYFVIENGGLFDVDDGINMENIVELEIRIAGAGDGDLDMWLDCIKKVPVPEQGRIMVDFDATMQGLRESDYLVDVVTEYGYAPSGASSRWDELGEGDNPTEGEVIGLTKDHGWKFRPHVRFRDIVQDDDGYPYEEEDYEQIILDWLC